LPDQSGTIALTSDIPASQDLASVLSVGNTTGANDIIMSTELGNRIIRSNPTTTANRFEIEFVDSGAMFLRRSSATDTGEVRLTTLGSQLNFLNNLGQFDTILTVNTGGVTLGTQTAVAKTFTLADEYSIVWNEASGGSNGSLTIPAPILTTNRTQSFQDADGVIALLSDIPALQNLNSVLAQGNTTGGRDIVMTGGDAIRTSSGGFPTDKRMRIQFNDNGGTFVDSIQIEAADPPPPGLPYSPRARATFSDTLLLGIWENNGLSRLQFQTTGDITVSSPNPTKLFTITNTYNLVLGTKTILPGTSGTLTLPAGSGTLALVSDVDQYKTGQVYSAVATVIDRTLDVNSTNLNEVANVLAILINDLKSVNILS
jgi:hypothetical protein